MENIRCIFIIEERVAVCLIRSQYSCTIILGILFHLPALASFLKEGAKVMDIIKVRGTSRTSAVAGAIAGVVREYKRAEVQAIGASAVNQAVKAMALAKSYLVQDVLDIFFVPEFVDVEIEEKIRTAIKFVVECK